MLDKFSPVLHLVQTVRDEAHRFAVTFHRTRRNTARLTSELEQIPGIGPKTLQKLLRHFGSLERVKQATESELIEIAGQNKRPAHHRSFLATVKSRVSGPARLRTVTHGVIGTANLAGPSTYPWQVFPAAP